MPSEVDSFNNHIMGKQYSHFGTGQDGLFAARGLLIKKNRQGPERPGSGFEKSGAGRGLSGLCGRVAVLIEHAFQFARDVG